MPSDRQEALCTPENPCRGCRERGVGPAHESETKPPDRYESDKVIWEFGSEMPEAVRPGDPGVDQEPSPSQDT